MQSTNLPAILVENGAILSAFLQREVKLDFYLPPIPVSDPSVSLLLINDGQNMPELGLSKILAGFYTNQAASPLLCVAIHAGTDRKMEYGVASRADYLGRGAKAGAYTHFVIRELLPFIQDRFGVPGFREKGFAGFSLGALMALDIVWHYPGLFDKAGMFSGSFWWRSVDQTKKHYSDDQHRIMQQEIRQGQYQPGLKFFFQCGNMDETMDRNGNGIIDSIDDTLDLVAELVKKGYRRERDIAYLEMPDGRHDIATWGRAMPAFLQWGWGNRQ